MSTVDCQLPIGFRARHEEIDDGSDQGEDDEDGEETEEAAEGTAAGLLVGLGSGRGFCFGNGLVKGRNGRGAFLGRGLAFACFLGGCCASETDEAEEVELLPGDEALAVTHAFAEADVDVDARAADVQGFALGTYGEADATLAYVHRDVGENLHALVESYTHVNVCWDVYVCPGMYCVYFGRKDREKVGY